MQLGSALSSVETQNHYPDNTTGSIIISLELRNRSNKKKKKNLRQGQARASQLRLINNYRKLNQFKKNNNKQNALFTIANLSHCR